MDAVIGGFAPYGLVLCAGSGGYPKLDVVTPDVSGCGS